MKPERFGWQADDVLASGRQCDEPRGRVRFWQPSSDRSQEFSCAYLDHGFAAPHVHEDWQFAVAAEPATLTLGAFRRYTAQANDVTVVAPYEVHTEGGLFGTPRGWRVLHVSPSMIQQAYGDDTTTVPGFDSPVVSNAGSARRLATLLRSSLNGGIEASDFTAQALDWLGHLLQRFAVRTANSRVPGSARAPIERARTYLQAHPTQPLVLPDLVGLAGVTASHLVRSFSRTVGLPPRSYHTQIRLARARRLLAQGRSATWVAYECCFADQSHLSRRFKEFYGLTPGAYQAQHQTPPASTAAAGFNAA